VTTTPLTLSSVSIPMARCSGCSKELPLSAAIESYSTAASSWVVVSCPSCQRCTPFRLEEQ
jgi:hypothetical protein